MELTRRGLLAAGVGLCGAGPASALLSDQAATVSGYVVPSAFGALADNPGAADGNVRAFNAMAAQAVATGAEMVIPKGTWFLTADGSGGSGWDVRPAAGRFCRIRGEGEGSIIRRAPTLTATKFASMVRLWVSGGGESFDLQGFAVDGNEAAFPYDPQDHWSYQQSHCVLLVSTSDKVAAASMQVRDLWLSGIVADGVKIGAQCEQFNAERIAASGRTRRPRSDIQFSRMPRFAAVSDCVLDAFESEPNLMVQGASMRLRNLVARSSFDLAAPDGAYDGRLTVDAQNCQGGLQRTAAVSIKTTNFYRLEGSFTGCTFASAPAARPAHNNVIRGSKLLFDQCTFVAGPSFADAAAAAPLFAHFEQADDSARFTACRFEPAIGVSKGSYLGVRGNSPGSTFLIRDGLTTAPLDYVVDLAGPSEASISGGALSASKAIVAISPNAAHRGRLSTSEQAGWKAPRTSVTLAGDASKANR